MEYTDDESLNNQNNVVMEDDSDVMAENCCDTEVVAETHCDTEVIAETCCDTEDVENETEVTAEPCSDDTSSEDEAEADDESDDMSEYCYVISIDDRIYGFNNSLKQTKRIVEKIATSYLMDYNTVYAVRIVKQSDNMVQIVGYVRNTIITYDQVFNQIKYEKVKRV